jgi:hypothetical protein
MNKARTITAAVVSATIMLLAGCDTSETTLTMAANTAGNLGISAWFAIDDPDDTVKETLKTIVDTVTQASVKVGDGESYVSVLTPLIQADVAKSEKLTNAQKNLINTGASVVLSGLDTFIDSNEKVKTNAELLSKVVAAFGKGCLTAIERSESSVAAQSIKKAHEAIGMKYHPRAKAFGVQVR